MGAISKHYGDVANWIYQIIDSCTNHKQIESVINLISNYRETYLDGLLMTERDSAIIRLVNAMEIAANTKYWELYESSIC